MKYEITTLPLARVFVFQIFSRVETRKRTTVIRFCDGFMNTFDIVPLLTESTADGNDLVLFYISVPSTNICDGSTFQLFVNS